jgi:hypothetical protein
MAPNRRISVFVEHPDMDSLAISIGEELDRAYDIKNREVAALRRQVETFTRQLSVLERRQLLVASRRKVRR